MGAHSNHAGFALPAERTEGVARPPKGGPRRGLSWELELGGGTRMGALERHGADLGGWLVHGGRGFRAPGEVRRVRTVRHGPILGEGHLGDAPRGGRALAGQSLGASSRPHRKLSSGQTSKGTAGRSPRCAWRATSSRTMSRSPGCVTPTHRASVDSTVIVERSVSPIVICPATS